MECASCRYATACSESYTNHMSVVHAGKSSLSSATQSVVGMRLRSTMRRSALHCDCGFSSLFGSVIGMWRLSLVVVVTVFVVVVVVVVVHCHV